jgi:hypothetical protein
MSAGIHPTITLDLAPSAIDERHRTAWVRAQRVTARRTRTAREEPRRPPLVRVEDRGAFARLS